MDIDLSAEFVYMAATLIHIKSKMCCRGTGPGTGRRHSRKIPGRSWWTGFWNTSVSRMAAEMLAAEAA